MDRCSSRGESSHRREESEKKETEEERIRRKKIKARKKKGKKSSKNMVFSSNVLWLWRIKSRLATMARAEPPCETMI